MKTWLMPYSQFGGQVYERELSTVAMLPGHYWQPLSPNGTCADSRDFFIICCFFPVYKATFFFLQIAANPHIELHLVHKVLLINQIY